MSATAFTRKELNSLGEIATIFAGHAMTRLNRPDMKTIDIPEITRLLEMFDDFSMIDPDTPLFALDEAGRELQSKELDRINLHDLDIAELLAQTFNRLVGAQQLDEQESTNILRPYVQKPKELAECLAAHGYDAFSRLLARIP